LTTEFAPSLSLPPTAPSTQAAKQLLLQIAEQEDAYQTALSDTYQDLGEKRFKSLRRALPMTRNKIEWEKVRTSLFLEMPPLIVPEQISGYKLGGELTASKGGLSS
jgi:capping protein alpha